jgi:hypothetical protein
MPLRPAAGWGKLNARHTEHTMRSALRMAAMLDPLGTPPTQSADWTAAVYRSGQPWGMYRNNETSDCTIADSAHAVMIATANRGQIVVPTDADVLAAYTAISGYDGVPGGSKDRGCYEINVCAYMRSTGLCGVRLEAYGSLDPRNLDHVKWGIALFGGVRMGFNLPQSADQQFEAGQNLTYVEGSPSVGGHDMRAVRYVTGWTLLSTWGALVWADDEFMLRCADEAHAELFEGWQVPGIDRATLVRDLAIVNDEMMVAA